MPIVGGVLSSEFLLEKRIVKIGRYDRSIELHESEVTGNCDRSWLVSAPPDGSFHSQKSVPTLYYKYYSGGTVLLLWYDCLYPSCSYSYDFGSMNQRKSSVSEILTLDALFIVDWTIYTLVLWPSIYIRWGNQEQVLGLNFSTQNPISFIIIIIVAVDVDNVEVRQ